MFEPSAPVPSLPDVVHFARHLSGACGVSAAVLEYAARAFVPEHGCAFCAACARGADGCCDPRNAHVYGCFEADRWNGLYIYHCPLGLGFVATSVYAGARAEYAIIAGPIVIGALSDTLADAGSMAHAVAALPCRTPEETNALARVQWALCAFLSGRTAVSVEAAETAQTGMHNALYAATLESVGEPASGYPLEIEQRLRRMITTGNRGGAQALINQLLGQLYFTEGGDLRRIRENAKGLVVLFSRAAIEGGADAQQIFGHTRRTFDTIDGFRTLDELSLFVTDLFYRFVGYVFDFDRIKHADVIHKVIAFVREHYANKITLDDVATHVHLSRPYLSRLLGDALGMPFADFVHSIRIDKGRELLERTDLSLADISVMTGFSDQSHFTRVFRKSVGMSPGEYRRKRGRLGE